MLSEDTADRLMERTAAMYAVSVIKLSNELHTSRYHPHVVHIFAVLSSSSLCCHTVRDMSTGKDAISAVQTMNVENSWANHPYCWATTDI